MDVHSLERHSFDEDFEDIFGTKIITYKGYVDTSNKLIFNEKNHLTVNDCKFRVPVHPHQLGDYVIKFLSTYGQKMVDICKITVVYYYSIEHSSYYLADQIKLNDIIFAGHAFILTFITIMQCVFYKRGGQVLSKFVYVFMILSGFYVFILFIVCLTTKLSILQTINYTSYIKIATSVIKYIPQNKCYKNILFEVFRKIKP
ncbi:hypothetical protein A3Q56_05889 [Intoshia linei]|uniref:Uncharacterized protein n=1 Tax=Intoshia linei TaxID=1819745 RepID=A0A177AWM1_9BILA|nr:hypothetical protein A3Q56_05889 [Intoshia linei]